MLRGAEVAGWFEINTKKYVRSGQSVQF